MPASKPDLIAGVHAVEEALAAGEPVERVTIAQTRRRDPALQKIVALARANGVPLDFAPEAAFNRYAGLRHQHVVAAAPPFRYTPWTEVRALVRRREDALIVLLDHVEDPQNLGAIIRSAEAAGAAAVVLPDRRSAAVTPAARRAAAGAASHIAVASVPNLARALGDAKADGCWVFGLTAGADGVPYSEVDFGGRCALVVGAEGKGLSRLVSERCDRLARIPLHGKVSSLNASAATAVVLFEALRQRAHADDVTRRSEPQTLVNP